MSPLAWERAKEAFAEALEVGPADRAAVLDRACRGDPALRAEVEAMLRAHEEAGGFLRDPSRGSPAASSELPPHDPAGRVLGDFRIVREIGRGGMGVVYEAEQLSLQRRVAVKVLPLHLTLERRTIERFLREARAAARLRHAHIVEVYVVGEHEGTHFFAMEFVEGIALDRAIARMREEGVGTLRAPASLSADRRAARSPASAAESKVHIETVVGLVAWLADALEYAHAHGVVHRDVKPSNVLLRPDGSPALTDFGLAREAGLPSLTQTGEFAGTPYYVSPEQAMARRMNVDHRSDIFSLGVTLYELLTLEKPFPGETSQEVLGRIMTKEPIDPHRLNPRIAPDLVTIVGKALEKDPDRRYATAAAFAEDLRAFLEYRPIAAKRASTATRAFRWARREPAKAALAALLALGVPMVSGLGGWAIAKAPELREAAAHAARQRVEGHLEEGYLELGEGSARRAIEAFEAALGIDPRSPEAIAGVALAHLREKRPAEALSFLDARPVDLPHAPAMDRIRAEALAEGGREAEAAGIETRLGAPESAIELFVEGSRQVRRGEKGEQEAFVRAVDLLTRACLRSTHVRALYHFERAKAVGHAEAGGGGPAREVAETLRILWPGSRMARFRAGFALQKPKVDLPAAIEAYRRAIEIDPRYAVAHNNLGLALHDSGDVEAAIAAYRTALEIDPRYALAHANLGNALRESGDLEGAIAACRTALEIDPRLALAHNNLGVALHEHGDREGAIAAYRKALEIDPRDARAHNNLGFALRDPGDLEGAIAQFRKALEIDPRFARANMNLGAALGESGDIEGAIAAYRKALEIDPRSAPAHNGLGVALRDSGDLEGAIEACRKALEIDPRCAGAYSDLGLALHKSGDLEGAIAQFRTVLKIDPRYARANINLGVALRDSGDLEGAIAAYRKAIDIDPRNWRAWNSLAWPLVDPDLPPERRDPAEGLRAARRAVELPGGENPFALDTLAQALFLNGEMEKAIETQVRALSLLRDSADDRPRLRATLEGRLARFRTAAAKRKPDAPEDR